MQQKKMEVLSYATTEAAAKALTAIGCDPRGVRIMQEKAVFRAVHLYQIDTRAANLLKQTFLARGAEAAVSRHSADLSEAVTDVLLFGTLRQYHEALARLRLQPWGLRVLADEIAELLEKSNEE